MLANVVTSLGSVNKRLFGISRHTQPTASRSHCSPGTQASVTSSLRDQPPRSLGHQTCANPFASTDRLLQEEMWLDDRSPNPGSVHATYRRGYIVSPMISTTDMSLCGKGVWPSSTHAWPGSETIYRGTNLMDLIREGLHPPTSSLASHTTSSYKVPQHGLLSHFPLFFDVSRTSEALPKGD